jgi:hypothetical protein
MNKQTGVEIAIERLRYLCDTIPALLQQIPDTDFSRKPAPGKWSKKEILGHLIDSAANNHQRFVRGQFEDVPFIIYDQDNWNNTSRYGNMSGEHVVDTWEAFNRHIIEIIKRIPRDSLQRLCKTNEPQPVTLQWLIEDYVKHMEHHLRQIVEY